jgi:hypothetical protein
MALTRAGLFALNRGEVSRLALARVDVDRLRLSAETQLNWQPRTLGPMTLRPGLKMITTTRSDLASRWIPFIYSSTDYAALEFTDETMRVLVDETPITRTTVTTTINGFTAAGTGWSNTTSGGGTVSFTGDKLTINAGSTGGVARTTQTVTLGTGASGQEHALRIVVERGPVKFRVGSTSGDDDLMRTTSLETGEHSLAVTPTGTFYIQFEASVALSKIVSSIALETTGAMTLPTPWPEDDLSKIRTTQSADVVFAACQGYQQRRIERRSARSWSVVLYKSDNGPFDSNPDTSISITPSAVSGNVTLTASKALFKSTHVGTLFRLFHTGQKATGSLSAEDTYSGVVRVTGVGTDRTVYFTISGTWSGTLHLQRSFDGPDTGFSDYTSYTTNASTYIQDGLNNSIVWYRIGFKAGNYTSGTASIELNYQGGGDAGICRVTAYTSSTSVSAEVLDAFSNTTSTTNWKEGAWSDRKGWPTAVELHEGRLWWAGNDRWWGSISDNYTSFDSDTEGDSGPIDRTIGSGPIANINWLCSLQRLLAGADASVIQAKSSSFDEPLTPTNFNLKTPATQGAAPLQAAKVDTRALYVQQSGRRVYEILFDVQTTDYKVNDMTRLNDEIGAEGFVDIAVQRQPDTQVHFVRGDGQVAVLLYDVQDEVEAWWRIETDGVVESAFVLPGELEDKVYYVVRRTINGSTKRFVERLARLDECSGQPDARLADSHVEYSGSATTTITGLSHLEGESVVCWGWNTATPFTTTVAGETTTVGRDFGTFTVSGGQITGLSAAVTNAVVGLSYSARFKSSKLAYAAQLGTALTQKKQIDHVGVILADTHAQGISFGDSRATALEPLPMVEDGEVIDQNHVWAEYDAPMHAAGGLWSTDARLVIEAASPRPATVMAAVVSMTTNG